MKTTLGFLLLVLAAQLGAQDRPWGKLTSEGFWETTPLSVKGDLQMSGSSTVFPLAQALTERFQSEGYRGQLAVDNIGTGAGFKRFAAGESDFANASRPITTGERRQAEARGQGRVLEFVLAKDAIVIVVNAQNKAVDDLSADQVVALFTDAETWQEVDPRWPAWKINRYIPETSHGTFDFFQEHFWDDKGTALKSAPRTQRFQDYGLMVDAVSKDRGAIAFVGYSYFREADQVRAVSFEGVAASKNTVENSSYGLSRPLLVYTLQGTLNSRPQSAAFLAFMLQASSRMAPKLGFFALTEAESKAQRRLLAEVLKASR